MDHGEHDMPMDSKCSVHMLWNTQIIDTCIVFPQWHISSTASFIFSFFIIVALGVFYEYLRTFQKAVDTRIAESLSRRPSKVHLPAGGGGSGRSSAENAREDDELLAPRQRPAKRRDFSQKVPVLYRIIRAVLYAATVFLSFFLMLVFMTYNAYLILAVVAGAAIGHYIFGGCMDAEAVLAASGGGKSMACH